MAGRQRGGFAFVGGDGELTSCDDGRCMHGVLVSVIKKRSHRTNLRVTSRKSGARSRGVALTVLDALHGSRVEIGVESARVRSQWGSSRSMYWAA